MNYVFAQKSQKWRESRFFWGRFSVWFYRHRWCKFWPSSNCVLAWLALRTQRGQLSKFEQPPGTHLYLECRGRAWFGHHSWVSKMSSSSRNWLGSLMLLGLRQSIFPVAGNPLAMIGDVLAWDGIQDWCRWSFVGRHIAGRSSIN